ncbi:PfkB family carbohydrate kinase [Spirosoma linguale]|uniref:PfkB domain protein n=1 Tax=Spirosoma linguale (strain ATCC 33905 / DSM 74 / LMG 10896 / Claus 1) TaxID=504472 RepID=D2QSR8_SPILD|nr:PfkB domain protein [Spirosoma linguale DSM 74]
MIDICAIGHISLDEVITPLSVKHMPGGTAFYFAKTLLNADINFKLVTALGLQEYHVVDDLRQEGSSVYTLPSKSTVYFQNKYSEDQNHRQQRVLRQASPFAVAQMPSLNAKVYHLGPLLANDIPIELIENLSKKGLVSLDIQGYLRHVWHNKVVYRDWADKKKVLPNVSILKANDHEMEVVTGRKNVREGAVYLADMGVREVIITLGSKGSLIYTGGIFYNIPAFKPTAVVDATGCGDTYMAGYLWKRVQGQHVQEAGEFGATLATRKVSSSGPYTEIPVSVQVK